MANFHPASEFHLLDFNSLIQGEFDTDGKNYNFSKCGSQYIYGSGWFISVYSENSEGLDEYDIWQLPEVLNRFIDWMAKNSVKEFKSQIRNLFLN